MTKFIVKNAGGKYTYLRSDASQETVGDEPVRTRARLEGLETWQRFSGHHHRHSSTF